MRPLGETHSSSNDERGIKAKAVLMPRGFYTKGDDNDERAKMKASEIQSDKLKRKKNSSKRAHFKVDRIISSRFPYWHTNTHISLCAHAVVALISEKRNFIHTFFCVF